MACFKTLAAKQALVLSCRLRKMSVEIWIVLSSFLLRPHSSAGQSHHLYQHRYSCVLLGLVE